MKSELYIGDMRLTLKNPQFRYTADLIFADPPYNIGQNYGETYDDNKSHSSFVRWLYDVVWTCRWLLKPKGSLFIMIGEKHTDDLGILLRERGFVRRRIAVWHESFGVYQRRNFANCCRYIHYCVLDSKHFTFNASAILIPSARQTKYNDARAAAGGRIPDNLFTDSRICGTFRERVHSTGTSGVPNQLPKSLVNRIVKVASNLGDTICDPFTGTGTTAAVCHQLSRNFIGFEINPDHAAVACRRLTPHSPLVTRLLGAE